VNYIYNIANWNLRAAHALRTAVCETLTYVTINFNYGRKFKED